MFHIEDAADPRIADYRNIPDPALLERHHAFAAEGRLVVERLLRSTRFVTRSLLLSPPAFAALGDLVEDCDVPVFVASQPSMNTITGFNIHRGCIALGDRGVSLDWRALAATGRRLVILERIANPDNVGAIFRSAAAFDVDAVLLGPDCADPLYRKAIRTSMAAALTIPFARIDRWPAALSLLSEQGYHVLALSPGMDAPPLRHVLTSRVHAANGAPAEMAGDGRPAGYRVALVAGHEGEGLTRHAIDAADTMARLPMAPGHDSLNVATAVGIALYELFNHHE